MTSPRHQAACMQRAAELRVRPVYTVISNYAYLSSNTLMDLKSRNSQTNIVIFAKAHPIRAGVLRKWYHEEGDCHRRFRARRWRTVRMRGTEYANDM